MNEENKSKLVASESETDLLPVRPLALSIRQPWAWLIINAGKDIENRSWPTKVRGRILVHAGKGMTRFEYDEALHLFDSLLQSGQIDRDIELPSFTELQRGGIIGSVEIVDCVSKSQSPWFFGGYGFVLRDPQPLSFSPCRGMLGFFRL